MSRDSNHTPLSVITVTNLAMVIVALLVAATTTTMAFEVRVDADVDVALDVDVVNVDVNINKRMVRRGASGSTSSAKSPKSAKSMKSAKSSKSPGMDDDDDGDASGASGESGSDIDDDESSPKSPKFPKSSTGGIDDDDNDGSGMGSGGDDGVTVDGGEATVEETEHGIRVTKKNKNGRIVWQKIIGESEDDLEVRDVVLDKSGFENVFAFGRKGKRGLTSVVLIKYNGRDGSVQWRKNISSDSDDSAAHVGFDADGNVFLSGSTFGAINDEDASLTPRGTRDMFVIMYAASGGELWRRQFGTTGSDVAAFGIANSKRELVIYGHTNHDNGGSWQLLYTKFDKDGNIKKQRLTKLR